VYSTVLQKGRGERWKRNSFPDGLLLIPVGGREQGQQQEEGECSFIIAAYCIRMVKIKKRRRAEECWVVWEGTSQVEKGEERSREDASQTHSFQCGKKRITSSRLRTERVMLTKPMNRGREPELPGGCHRGKANFPGEPDQGEGVDILP